MPIQLRTPDSPRSASTQSDCPILKLVGVLSLWDGQYTSLSEPFVETTKKLIESQTLVDETEWLLFNSKAEVDRGLSICLSLILYRCFRVLNVVSHSSLKCPFAPCVFVEHFYLDGHGNLQLSLYKSAHWPLSTPNSSRISTTLSQLHLSNLMTLIINSSREKHLQECSPINLQV